MGYDPENYFLEFDTFLDVEGSPHGTFGLPVSRLEGRLSGVVSSSRYGSQHISGIGSAVVLLVVCWLDG